MTDPQIARSSASPVAEDRATGAAGPVLPPDTVPGRSTSEAAQKERIVEALARLEEILGRERTVAILRKALGLPSDATAANDSGHALLSVVLPVGLLGGLAALLAGPARLSTYARVFPLTPTPNGFTLLIVLGLGGLVWWRLHRLPTADEPHGLDCPDEAQALTDGDPRHDPWLGSEPEHPPARPAHKPEPLPAGYRHRRYVAHHPEHLRLVRGPLSDYWRAEDDYAQDRYPEDVPT